MFVYIKYVYKCVSAERERRHYSTERCGWTHTCTHSLSRSSSFSLSSYSLSLQSRLYVSPPPPLPHPFPLSPLQYWEEGGGRWGQSKEEGWTDELLRETSCGRSHIEELVIADGITRGWESWGMEGGGEEGFPFNGKG